MDFLYFLERLRTPFLDAFFSAVTRLGEENFFIVVALLVFWCIDKKRGYLVLTVGFFGTVINQFLKLAFRVDRPWMTDPDFSIVESARAAATGYAFPSGHTQNAVGTFGVLGVTSKRLWLRILCGAAVLLVPFSRMYLGVHTPLDVGVAFITAVLLIVLFIPVFKNIGRHPHAMYIIFGAMSVSSAALLAYAWLYGFPATIDIENLTSGRTDAASLFGMTLGILLAYPLEHRYVKFETKASLLAQALKLTTGLILTLAIKSGLKYAFAYIFGAGALLPQIIRYAIIVIFAVTVWPLTFSFFGKIKKSSPKEKVG